MFKRDNCKIKIQNNAQHHSPRPIPNDRHYFRPIVVFAGHYLKRLNATLLPSNYVLICFTRRNINFIWVHHFIPLVLIMSTVTFCMATSGSRDLSSRCESDRAASWPPSPWWARSAAVGGPGGDTNVGRKEASVKEGRAVGSLSLARPPCRRRRSSRGASMLVGGGAVTGDDHFRTINSFLAITGTHWKDVIITAQGNQEGDQDNVPCIKGENVTTKIILTVITPKKCG